MKALETILASSAPDAIQLHDCSKAHTWLNGTYQRPGVALKKYARLQCGSDPYMTAGGFAATSTPLLRSPFV